MVHRESRRYRRPVALVVEETRGSISICAMVVAISLEQGQADGCVRVVGFVVIILQRVGVMILVVVGRFENLLEFWFARVVKPV